MSDKPRLIEAAFPLEQTSIDSVHEKSVRHGHISTLHIWPARRPLAASRAALISTLLPDPETPQERKELLDRLGGRVVEKTERKRMPNGKTVERLKRETVGGILHWGRESNPDVSWYRKQILNAYGNPPTVFDPFAGGGAIPLEAMRLGCFTIAMDLNPVAWLLLRCTLEYPQRFSGRKMILPEHAMRDPEFTAGFVKGQSRLAGAKIASKSQQATLFEAFTQGKLTRPEADLSWHVRAWSRWVLDATRREVSRFYPVYAELEAPGTAKQVAGEVKLISADDDGTSDISLLNAEFSQDYLRDKNNPRWIPKPTVAYLWARTVRCKNCRAEVPLLKTRWLCKKEKKRVLLTMEPNSERTGVVFGVQSNVPVVGTNAAQRREYDKTLGQGTMNKNGVFCPCCGKPGTVAMDMADLRQEGLAGRIDAIMTAVVVEGTRSKEYRLPTEHERQVAIEARDRVELVFAKTPFGRPVEETPGVAGSKRNSSSLRLYGFRTWSDLFSNRQLMAIGTFINNTRAAIAKIKEDGAPCEFAEAIGAYLATVIGKLTDYNASLCTWHISRETLSHVFVRYAFPMNWDFAEVNPLSSSSGNYSGCVDWVCRVIEHALAAAADCPGVRVLRGSAATTILEKPEIDVIVTDPPYYDAISYSDIMDFFYVWLRRALIGLSPDYDKAFGEPLAPKWDEKKDDGELIDNPALHGWDLEKSKAAYERGMFRAFQMCHNALKTDGKLVIVFAHKDPDAWEALVSALIRAGFVVDASWPIQTEMGNRTRALGSAALSSSVWLVCKKRPSEARPGWDNKVLDEMRDLLYGRFNETENRWEISPQLREYWDAGIRGPDFVWAATGPALEAYSSHPVVKKANEPGQVMQVHEFLRHVRRMVVDFVVGRVLSHNEGTEAVTGLDDITTYYLLHRNDFGMDDAPIGACILYAVSCGLSDTDLTDRYEVLVRSGGQEAKESDEEETMWAEDQDDAEIEEGTGSTVRIRPWNHRRRKDLGLSSDGRPAPMIDQIHKLMHLWKGGDLIKVDDYLDSNGLRGNQLFHRTLQSLIELAGEGNEERALLESVSNHLTSVGPMTATRGQQKFDMEMIEIKAGRE